MAVVDRSPFQQSCLALAGHWGAGRAGGYCLDLSLTHCPWLTALVGEPTPACPWQSFPTSS